jgi:4a-hydroxytetrahydrobiopterin dehydratase
MIELLEMRCQACTGDTPPLKPKEIFRLHEQVPDWLITTGHKLVRRFTCGDFLKAIDFVTRVASIAEEEDHHPAITIDYKRVTFTIWTHAIDNLSENDFILAAKIDRAFDEGDFSEA